METNNFTSPIKAIARIISALFISVLSGMLVGIVAAVVGSLLRGEH